jgi:arginine-tRNA-protein transferase
VTNRQTSSPAEIQFYATATYPCSYINGRIARSQVASPSDQVDSHVYSELVQHGFRRSGGFVYRPHCDNCRACMSIRIPVAEFKPSRSQRRAISQHGHLVAYISRPHFSQEHYELYLRYQQARHPGGGMDQDDMGQYIEFLTTSPVDTFLVEFREVGDADAAGKLKMVSIIDQLDDGLSAVYTFYEPTPKQNFGTFNILWQISKTQALGLERLYLGYWIETCEKMAYKIRFQPSEVLSAGQWIKANVSSKNMSQNFTR